MSSSRLAVVLSAFVVGAVGSADTAPAPSPGEQMWATMLRLEGTWVSPDGDGDGSPDVTVVYRPTAGGSAMVETLFPGTEHEMVTVYHRDGEGLAMTHYCMMGNQPFLKTTPEATAGRLVFACVGGSGVDLAGGTYMGAATLTVHDPDRMTQEWGSFKDGKRTEETMRFELRRAAR